MHARMCALRCGHDGIFLGINGKLGVGEGNNLKGTGATHVLLRCRG